MWRYFWNAASSCNELILLLKKVTWTSPSTKDRLFGEYLLVIIYARVDNQLLTDASLLFPWDEAHINFIGKQKVIYTRRFEPTKLSLPVTVCIIMMDDQIRIWRRNIYYRRRTSLGIKYRTCSSEVVWSGSCGRSCSTRLIHPETQSTRSGKMLFLPFQTIVIFIHSWAPYCWNDSEG